MMQLVSVKDFKYKLILFCNLLYFSGGQTERKISFVLHEPDNESENSSNTTLTKEGEEGTNVM